MTENVLESLRNDGERLMDQLESQGYSPYGTLAALLAAVAAVCCRQDRLDLLDFTLNDLAASAFLMRKKELDNVQ